MILNKYVYLHNRFGNYAVSNLFGGFMKHVRFFDDRCRKGAFLTLIRQQRCHLHTWSISVLYFATRVMKSYTFVRMCII